MQKKQSTPLYGQSPKSPGKPALPGGGEPAVREIEALVALFGQRRYSEAEMLAQAMTARFPFHGFGWKALGAVLKQQGRRGEALGPLRQAADLMPEDAEAHYNLGNVFLELGRLAEAETSYRRTLAINAFFLAAQYNLGNALQGQARFAEAEASYRSALTIKPDFAEAHGNLGVVLREQGRFAEAETSFRRLLEITPEDAQAHSNLANILHDQHSFADAEASYRRALQIQPDFGETHYNLGNFLKVQNRLDEAEASYRKALAIRPDFAEAYFNLGDTLKVQGKTFEAEASYRQALVFSPHFADAYSHLGIVLREQGRLAEAEASYRRALEIKPDYAEAWNNLGNALREQDRIAEAEGSYRHALALKPDYAEAHYNLGNIFKGQSRHGEAGVSYRQALALRQDYAEAHNNLGNTLKEQSRLEEASLSFEAAISLKPDFIESHYSLSSLKTYRDSDPHLGMLERQLGQVEALPIEARVRYWFALGKIREDLGRYDDSFAAYQEGNRLQHAMLAWDEVAEDAVLERMVSVFSREFFAARPRPSHAGKAPIFIVGMPRSGTSLLEQILSTHPGVYGAGELPDMSEVVTAAMPNAAFERFPEAVSGLSAEDFRRLGERYTAQIWRHAPTAERITDKMPANFFYLGMIYLMLPNAKIIHAMRDPMDSCFSCYSRLFNYNNLAFAYDLGTLGRYYSRYIKLMRHWHAVLPADTILDLRYEDMVGDTEGQARRLLAYLDLPWHDGCLAFHQNKRHVKTASAAQVRKPIYQTSLARWKRYGDHLAPLFDLVKNYRE